MKPILIATFFFTSTLSYPQTGEKNFIDQNYIEVTGKAEMEVTPDLIYLTILIRERDTKNKITIQEQEKLMLSKLQELGIDLTKDLTVRDLTSNFKYYLLSKTDIILSKEYQLIVHDGKTAAKVFAELEKLEISNVSIDRVDHTKIIEFRKEVKVQAIKAAKEKSEYLAKAIGQNTGRAIYIQELDVNLYVPGGNVSNAYLYRATGAVHRGTSVDEPEIDFEKIKLEYSMLARFELK